MNVFPNFVWNCWASKPWDVGCGSRRIPWWCQTTGTHRNIWEESLPFLPQLSPGMEFWMGFFGCFGVFLAHFYLRTQELIPGSRLDIPAGNALPTPRLIITHGLIARYTPAHLLAWQRARSPDGPRDSQGQRCQKKRWISMTPLVPPLPPPLGGDSSEKSAPRRRRIALHKTRELGLERPIRSFTAAPRQCLISTLILPNADITGEEEKPGCSRMFGVANDASGISAESREGQMGCPNLLHEISASRQSPGEQARDRHGKCSP